MHCAKKLKLTIRLLFNTIIVVMNEFSSEGEQKAAEQAANSSDKQEMGSQFTPKEAAQHMSSILGMMAGKQIPDEGLNENPDWAETILRVNDQIARRQSVSSGDLARLKQILSVLPDVNK